MQVVLLSSDLMFNSRLEGAVKRAGGELAVAATVDDAVALCVDQAARLLIVDLQLTDLNIAELIPTLRKKRPQDLAILAFAPHVHEHSLEAARNAGCNAVVSRGEIDRKIDELLARFLAA